MSGGGTLDRVLVSTTMSGWAIPMVAEEGEGGKTRQKHKFKDGNA